MPRLISIVAMTVALVSISPMPLAAGTASQGAPVALNNAVQLAENNVACSRRGCRTLRPGCYVARAAHPRDNRIRCNKAARG